MTDDNQTLLEDADRDPDLTFGSAWSLAQTCVQVLVADCSIWRRKASHQWVFEGVKPLAHQPWISHSADSTCRAANWVSSCCSFFLNASLRWWRFLFCSRLASSRFLSIVQCSIALSRTICLDVRSEFAMDGTKSLRMAYALLRSDRLCRSIWLWTSRASRLFSLSVLNILSFTQPTFTVWLLVNSKLCSFSFRAL